jgi:hypothetical protein
MFGECFLRRHSLFYGRGQPRQGFQVLSVKCVFLTLAKVCLKANFYRSTMMEKATTIFNLSNLRFTNGF